MFGFGFKARKFWLLAVNSGFGAGKSQARPKANPGHYFGLALALVTKPKKPGLFGLRHCNPASEEHGVG
jgi:hypothetical protein